MLTRFPLLLFGFLLLTACGGGSGGGPGGDPQDAALDLAQGDLTGDLGQTEDLGEEDGQGPGEDQQGGPDEASEDNGAPGEDASADLGGDDCGPDCDDWTILVYLVADNDLEAYSFPNLEEMSLAAARAGVNLVVQVDWVAGLEYRDNQSWDDQDYKGTWRLLMKPGGFDKLEDLGEKNMANPEVLADFVSFGVSQYPARHYALVFWDHGGGLLGFGWDETSNQDALLPAELADAVGAGLADAGFGGRRLDLVGFDACLMASYEVAALLEPVARYFVASEELEGGPGWDYRVFGALSSEDSPADLGTLIIDGYMNKSVNEYEDDLATLSLLDLGLLDGVGGALEALVEALVADLSSHGPALAVAQGKAQYYGYAEYEDQVDSGQVDLGDLVALLKAEAPALESQAQALLVALDAAVVDEAHASGVPGSTGLAIHFPMQEAIFERELLVKARPPKFWIDFLDAWYDWLGANLKVQLSEVLYDPSGADDGFEWIELKNAGSLPVDLSGWSLGWGGSDLDQGHFQLAGTLQPGACVVVGGPQSSAANGSPSYFQAQDFGSDLQNSGSPGDGLGLFNVPSKNIQPDTVPFDAVIYGADNNNGLLDETGQANPPDVADAPQGSSIERVGDAWQIQASPSPGVCK